MDEKTQSEQARQLHETLEYIGLRAQATTVGLLQLCSELVKAGVIGGEAIQRIKDAIHREISLSRRSHDRGEFEETLRKRLDAIFPQGETAQRATRVGSVDDMQSAFDPERHPRQASE